MGEWVISSGDVLRSGAALANHATLGLGAQSTLSGSFPCAAIGTMTIIFKWYKAGFKAATWASEQNK